MNAISGAYADQNVYTVTFGGDGRAAILLNVSGALIPSDATRASNCAAITAISYTGNLTFQTK